ncbi:MAG: NAD(P)/FAD-dependent oxidoreductase [Brachybacterium sp.]|nr:NAD(P)/FAD-dependent oxidoreductase [Brachybacterium sp.]
MSVLATPSGRRRPRGPLLRRTIPAADGESWPHVLILGGGFAGANAVLGLRDARVRVTLVDRHVYKVFQPLLYQVATAGLNSGDVTMVLRSLSLQATNMRYLQGEVVDIDAAHDCVRIDRGGQDPEVLTYDYLVIANGATTTFFGTPGAEEFSLPMYTRAQALAIRNRIFAELERTSSVAEVDRLCVSVVGGGPTGVEIAGALADFRTAELDILYPELPPGALQISVIQRGPDLLKEFDQEIRDYAAETLEDRGVILRRGKGVKSVGYDYVELDDGEIVESDVTIWAAGVAIDERVARWNLPQTERGRLQVDDHLQVTGIPNVFAAGDIAAGPTPLPQLAQPAIQEGRHVAKEIAARVAGRHHEKPFRYKDLGTMATIGRRAAVADIPWLPIDLTGTLGWIGWMGVHVSKLLGRRNRRAVTMNLLSLYAGTRSTRQPNPVMGDVDSIAAAHAFDRHAEDRKFGPGARG